MVVNLTATRYRYHWFGGSQNGSDPEKIIYAWTTMFIIEVISAI